MASKEAERTDQSRNAFFLCWMLLGTAIHLQECYMEKGKQHPHPLKPVPVRPPQQQKPLRYGSCRRLSWAIRSVAFGMWRIQSLDGHPEKDSTSVSCAVDVPGRFGA